MSFSEAQAQRLAQQIHDRFGLLIHVACEGTGVMESFLAGFTSVEAGKDGHGNIVPDAVRFEKGVYQDLISVRDHGFCWINGKKHSTYSGVRQDQIADANDEAIRALSTSYSFTQIMGWHVINNLKCTVADLRDRDQHFHFCVQLLKIVGGRYMTAGDLTAVLHIWNTGSANGKTYHEDYVTNALMVKKHYDAILRAKPNAFLYDPSSAAAAPSFASFDSPNDLLSDEPAISSPASPSAGQALPGESPTPPPELAPAPETAPAGDDPATPPTTWFNVEDWKPRIKSWLARIWSGNLLANAAQTIGNAAGAIKDPEHWYIYAGIALAGVILLIGLGMLVSLPLLIFFIWNRREILHMKVAQFMALSDPTKKNVGLMIERK